MIIGDSRYISFTTFRRSGDEVSTPVWIAPLPDGRFAFTTKFPSGKTKRLAHTARVRMQPSDARGRVEDGATSVDGQALVVHDGADHDAALASLQRKYGIQFRLVQLNAAIRRRLGRGGAAVVVITPDQG